MELSRPTSFSFLRDHPSIDTASVIFRPSRQDCALLNVFEIIINELASDIFDLVNISVSQLGHKFNSFPSHIGKGILDETVLSIHARKSSDKSTMLEYYLERFVVFVIIDQKAS